MSRLLLCLLALVTMFLVVAVFLPSRYLVQRSIVIQARPEAIFPWVNNLKKWPEWTVWTKESDPTMTFSYDGPAEGVGAVSKWDGKKVGDGSMTLTEASPASGIKYDLVLMHGKLHSVGGIGFESEGTGTRVVWLNEGELGINPISRYFGLVMDRQIGPDFQQGLQKLKTRLETK